MLAFLSTLSIATGCGQPENLIVDLNEKFILSPGQYACITGGNLEIKFQEVIEDSRCPIGVECFWAGEVSCVIELTKEGSFHQIELTESGLTDEYSRDRYEGYEIIFHVTPYPEAEEVILKDTYRLHLIISKFTN